MPSCAFTLMFSNRRLPDVRAEQAAKGEVLSLVGSERPMRGQARSVAFSIVPLSAKGSTTNGGLRFML